jgi:hypothetical protein
MKTRTYKIAILTTHEDACQHRFHCKIAVSGNTANKIYQILRSAEEDVTVCLYSEAMGPEAMFGMYLIRPSNYLAHPKITLCKSDSAVTEHDLWIHESIQYLRNNHRSRWVMERFGNK